MCAEDRPLLTYTLFFWKLSSLHFFRTCAIHWSSTLLEHWCSLYSGRSRLLSVCTFGDILFIGHTHLVSVPHIGAATLILGIHLEHWACLMSEKRRVGGYQKPAFRIGELKRLFLCSFLTFCSCIRSSSCVFFHGKIEKWTQIKTPHHFDAWCVPSLPYSPENLRRKRAKKNVLDLLQFLSI